MTEVAKKRRNPWFKRLLLGLLVAGLLGAGAVWYVFNEKFSDTKDVKADFTVDALDLIHEFEKNDSLANKKYAEKIMVVNGMISDIERADSTLNIKMSDTVSGSYVIFAFQQQHQQDAKKLKPGATVAIKGSCSGGAYSRILETEYITFKRCALNN